MTKRKKTSEAQVADYWLTHDSVGEIDWAAKGVLLETATFPTSRS